MTEQEWLECTDPQKMLDFQSRKFSERKMRLFGCACCRRVWEGILDPRCREAVAASERFADGLMSERELDLLTAAAEEAYEEALSEGDGNESKLSFGAFAASYSSSPALSVRVLVEAIGAAVDVRVEWGHGAEEEIKGQVATELLAQATLLREIFGNPYRPVRVDLAWLTSTVTSLARQMYESRDFTPMPILADALEDASCDNADILDHLRGPGPHVRGCWVLDLLLNKS